MKRIADPLGDEVNSDVVAHQFLPHIPAADMNVADMNTYILYSVFIGLVVS